MISIIELVLQLLKIALEAAQVNKVATEVIDAIQAAITELEKVRNTPVTYAQLEELRVKPTW